MGTNIRRRNGQMAPALKAVKFLAKRGWKFDNQIKAAKIIDKAFSSNLLVHALVYLNNNHWIISTSRQFSELNKAKNIWERNHKK